ncbi:MAG: glycosyltransferase family 39 protein [Candidatus Omnitrophica bacterium]|nr:glycosyltransferase family 39 protein [Candidatus Omnitrophota bacterium]
MPNKDKPLLKNPVILAILLVCGLILRLYHLGVRSLWFDEAYTIFNGQYLASVVSRLGALPDRYPSFLSDIPVYFWSLLSGRNEFTLRLFSVVFGIAAIWLIYKFGLKIFGQKTALIAAFLLAISPIHIYYSQELRPYSLILLISLGSALFLLKALEKGALAFWTGYVILNVLNIYLHYMTIFFLFAQVVFFLIFMKDYKNQIRKWIFYNSVIFVLLAPWLINSIILLKASLGPDLYLWVPSWAKTIGAKNIFFTIKNFSIGYNVEKQAYVFITVFLTGILAFGITRLKKNEVKNYVLCLCCFVLPILSMFLISKVKVWYVDRYVLGSLPFYYILIGNSLAKIRTRYAFLLLGVVALFCAFSLNNYYQSRSLDAASCIGIVYKYDYKDAADYLAQNMEDGDIVFHTSYSSTVPFMYYLKKSSLSSANERPAFVLFPANENKIEARELLLKGCKFKNIDYDDFVSGKRRIWLVCSDWFFNEKNCFDSKAYQIARWMQDNYKEKESCLFKGIILYLFER